MSNSWGWQAEGNADGDWKGKGGKGAGKGGKGNGKRFKRGKDGDKQKGKTWQVKGSEHKNTSREEKCVPKKGAGSMGKVLGRQIPAPRASTSAAVPSSTAPRSRKQNDPPSNSHETYPGRDYPVREKDVIYEPGVDPPRRENVFVGAHTAAIPKALSRCDKCNVRSWYTTNFLEVDAVNYLPQERDRIYEPGGSPPRRINVVDGAHIDPIHSDLSKCDMCAGTSWYASNFLEVDGDTWEVVCDPTSPARIAVTNIKDITENKGG